MKKTSNKALIGIFAFCVTCMANNMTMSVIAYIMQSYPNESSTTVLTILTTPALVAMIFAFFVGTLSSKFSTKAVLIFAQLAMFAEGMIFLFLGQTSIYVLWFAAGLVGFNQGATYTFLGTLLASNVEDNEKRATLTGICTALMNVGGVVITMVGGVIAASYGWQKAYMLWFILLAAIVIEIICIPADKPAAVPAPDAAAKPEAGKGEKMPVLVWLIAFHYLFYFMFLYAYGSNISEYIINVYKLGTSVESGIANSAVTAGGVVAGALFGAYSKVLKKWTFPVMVLLSAIGLGLCLVMTTNVLGVYAAGLLCGFSMSGAAPYVTMFMQQITNSPAQYGKAMSIWSGFMNIGMFIAVYFLAFCAKIFGESSTDIHAKFVVGAVGAALCVVTAIPLYVRKTKAD
ncbi:MAG: MFS transporter [Lachnospiraceae bacterium]|nr:MFS transporter [Lachnospiraceae bacterium]